MRVLLKADGRTKAGGTSLIQHNERLQDPLDPVKRSLGKITAKRSKTDSDHEAAAWVEFVGGLYTDPEVLLDTNLNVVGNGHQVIIPAANILRCLQDGATRSKKGKDVLRGVMPIDEHSILEAPGLDGLTPQQMYASGDFTIRKGVVVQRNRITRTRPIFEDWELQLLVEMDPLIFDLDALAKHWADAGRYCGLGDNRPVHGRFSGTLEEVEDDA